MWERCGVVRTEAGLLDALDAPEVLRDAASDIDVRPSAEAWTDLAHALDLRAGLTAAEATLRCAIERRETRGAQIRGDFPELDRASAVNFDIDAEMKPWPVPVPAVPTELAGWLDRPLPTTAERLPISPAQINLIKRSHQRLTRDSSLGSIISHACRPRSAVPGG